MLSEIKLKHYFFCWFCFASSFSYSDSFNFIESTQNNILTPTARFNAEGDIDITISKTSPINEINVSASPYNWLQASLYYKDINVRRYYPGSDQSYKDKGFSFKLKLKDEDKYPAIALGFNDIAGTSIYKSEYLVFSKILGHFDMSAGIGFGALGSRNNVNNFLREGERSKWDFSTGGEINYSDFFKGDSAFFGAISYRSNYLNGAIFTIEYDSDDYSQYYELVPGYKRYQPKSRINYGVKIPLFKNFLLQVAQVKGNELSVSFNFKTNISKKKVDNYSIIKTSKKNEFISILDDLKKIGVYVQNIDIDHEGRQISVVYAQSKYYDQELLAYRIKNYLRNHYGNRSYSINLTAINGAYKLSQLSYAKYSDRPVFSSYKKKNYSFNPRVLYPIVNYSLAQNISSHIGSPSGFFFGGLEGLLNAEIALNNNFQLNSSFSFPIYDNYDELSYDPNPSDLYQVRTNIQEYLKQGKTGFNEFSLNYFKTFSNNNFFQASIGHFEQMYSGVHIEFLRRPFSKIFSYGFEISRVYQREFNKSFTDFKDYRTNLGHLNLYAYEPKNMMLFHLSYGRYLAKDIGFTLDISRYFLNGAQIGAFFSKTNISKASFGEGSFDKGVYVKYPLHIFNANRNSRSFSKYTYRPIQRDGAAKLNFPRSLFDLTRDSQLQELFTN